MRKEFKDRQTDIATVLSVANSTVTKYKYDYLEHPENLFPLPGKPSKIRDVFQHVENFTYEQWDKGRSLPLGVLLEFLADKHHVFVTRKCLREYMINHGYPYVMGIPTDAMCIAVTHADMEAFYTRSLPDALRGVHPSLVFNMDEMVAERYADAKHVKVFVPEEHDRGEGMAIGVPRSSRMVTLMVCIVLDGSRLTPAVVIKNVTVNSLLFENGYGQENITCDKIVCCCVDGEVFRAVPILKKPGVDGDVFDDDGRCEARAVQHNARHQRDPP